MTSNASTKGMSFSALLLVALLFLLAGGGATLWALSHYPDAARIAGVARNQPAQALATTPQAAQAARVNYNGLLSAHLQRYKQYPSGAKAAGEQGVAMLSFTVSRNGQVLSARLARSSGSSALDAETMAMIRRAQPLPSFPPEMTQSSASYTVPVRFFLR